MSPAGAGVVVVEVVVVVVGATETLATALVGYSVTVLTSSENCLARPGEARETFNIKFCIYQNHSDLRHTNNTVVD